MESRERRREVRLRKVSAVSLVWEDSCGESKYAVASSHDLSRSGMGIRLREAIDRNSYVRVRADELKLSGTTVVRYCIHKGGTCLIGLEFLGGTKIQALLLYEMPLLMMVN